MEIETYPLDLAQALHHSKDWADSYPATHLLTRAGMDEKAMLTVAMGRLEWLSQTGRQDLRGVIDAAEFGTLCNTFQGEIADPHSLEDIASAVADDLGYDYDESDASSDLVKFLEKLASLSAIQRLALRDLIERFWYQPDGSSCNVEDFLIANGILAGE